MFTVISQKLFYDTAGENQSKHYNHENRKRGKYETSISTFFLSIPGLRSITLRCVFFQGSLPLQEVPL
jgi:hypothetical protein